MIVAVERKACDSFRQFCEMNGEVEVERPSHCPRPKEECGSLRPMRRNGSYPKQVIYWGLLFVLAILRFRCGRCGRTVSRPYSWLVPYKRFSAEVIATAIDEYASSESSYRELSDSLSEAEFVEEQDDVRQSKLFVQQKESLSEARTKKDGSRPSHTTVFRWVEYACRQAESSIQQLQKELVRRGKDLKQLPPESAIENANTYKARSKTKAEELDRLAFATVAARGLLDEGKRPWRKLRTYFLAKAEFCKDLLTSTPTGCQLHRLCNLRSAEVF